MKNNLEIKSQGNSYENSITESSFLQDNSNEISSYSTSRNTLSEL